MLLKYISGEVQRCGARSVILKQTKKCCICDSKPEEDSPNDVYRSDKCRTPIIKANNAIDKDYCPIYESKES